MSETSRLQVNVFLSGENLEKFSALKKRLYIENDAELLRACLRFMYDNYSMVEKLKELGLDTSKPPREIRKDLQEMIEKLT